MSEKIKLIKLPKEITERAARYRMTMEQMGMLGQSLRKFFQNPELMGEAIMTDFHVTDNPAGVSLGDGRWVEEWTSDGKRYSGHYYWMTEDDHFICVSYLSEGSLCG